MSTTTAARLVDAEAEVVALKEQAAALWRSQVAGGDPSTARLRPGPLKQHQRRVASGDRQGMELVRRITQAEARVTSLRRLLTREAEAARPKLTAADLAGARLVRDRFGWHCVVKVNRRTVKVAVPPGMDDLLPIDRVLEVRA